MAPEAQSGHREHPPWPHAVGGVKAHGRGLSVADRQVRQVPKGGSNQAGFVQPGLRGAVLIVPEGITRPDLALIASGSRGGWPPSIRKRRAGTAAKSAAAKGARGSVARALT